MNAVEIEEAISNLADEPFDAAEFPFRLLEAFGNKETTIKRLRSGASNASDVEGGVLQRSNIHIAVCKTGAVTHTLKALKSSPATVKAKAKFVFATDGDMLEVEELSTGDAVACKYGDLPKHFGLLGERSRNRRRGQRPRRRSIPYNAACLRTVPPGADSTVVEEEEAAFGGKARPFGQPRCLGKVDHGHELVRERSGDVASDPISMRAPTGSESVRIRRHGPYRPFQPWGQVRHAAHPRAAHPIGRRGHHGQARQEASK
jgi:hypothetical protein